MDSKILPSIKTELPEVYPEDSGVQSFNKQTVTEGHVVDKMDSEIPAVVKTEQPEVYLDYTEILPSSHSCPSIIKQENSQMEMYHTTDFKLVKQELSDVLSEDKTHAFSKMVNWASGSTFQELAGNSNTESTKIESDYKVLFNLENCSHISENVSPMIELNKNQPLSNEEFQFQIMETGVNHSQISRGSLDLTADSTSRVWLTSGWQSASSQHKFQNIMPVSGRINTATEQESTTVHVEHVSENIASSHVPDLQVSKTNTVHKLASQSETYMKVGKKGRYVVLPVKNVNKLMVRDLLHISGNKEEVSKKTLKQDFRNNKRRMLNQKLKRLNHVKY